MWSGACRQPRRLLAALRQLRFAGGAAVRDPRFANVGDADLQFFESVLGAAGVVTDPHELQPYNRYVRSHAKAFPPTKMLFTMQSSQPAQQNSEPA